MELLLYLVGLWILIGVLSGIYIYFSAMSDTAGGCACGTVILIVVCALGSLVWPLLWLAWWITGKVDLE